jgi:hypothetical protein
MSKENRIRLEALIDIYDKTKGYCSEVEDILLAEMNLLKIRNEEN